MLAGRFADVPALVDAARAGAPRAIARLISLIEDGQPALLLSDHPCPFSTAEPVRRHHPGRSAAWPASCLMLPG